MWLRHPSLTGLEPAAFDDLAARYQLWCAEHPPIFLPGKRPDGGPGAGSRRLSVADQLVVFLLTKRWSMAQTPLAEATGLAKSRIGATLREATPVLTALGYTVPVGALTVTTAQQLAEIAGTNSHPRNPHQDLGVIVRQLPGEAGVPKLVEGALAASIPTLLGLLASLLGIENLASKVKSVFHAVARPVNKVLDKIIGFIVNSRQENLGQTQGSRKKDEGEVQRQEEGRPEGTGQ